jgi:hypothetical protein
MTSAEGDGVVGVAVGVRVGVVVGCAVVGTTVGCAVVGATVGADVEVGATVVGATVVGSDVGAADAAVGLEEGLRNTISVDCPVPWVRSFQSPSVMYTHIMYTPAGAADEGTCNVRSNVISTPAATLMRSSTPPDTVTLRMVNAELRNTAINVTGTGEEYTIETGTSVTPPTTRPTDEGTTPQLSALATLGAAVGAVVVGTAVGDVVVVAGINVGAPVGCAVVGIAEVGAGVDGASVGADDVGDAVVGMTGVGWTVVGVAVVGVPVVGTAVGAAVVGVPVVGLNVDGVAVVGAIDVGDAVTGLCVVGADDGATVTGADDANSNVALRPSGAPKRLAYLRSWEGVVFAEEK